jgi:RNA polymerase sigma factor (sigma-70 family)
MLRCTCEGGHNAAKSARHLVAAPLTLLAYPTVSVPTTSPSPPAADQTRWFTNEVHAHDSQLKAYVRGSFPGLRDVDDVVQESYLRIWKARAAQPIRSAKAFLFTVARGVALNVLRKKQNAPFEPFGDFAASRVLDETPNAAETAILHERIGLLADALMTLPPRCREITVLHKVQGFSQKEVAARLGLSERTVETQVRIGVARCLAQLQQHRFVNYLGDET